jgi:hypothetical protein
MLEVTQTRKLINQEGQTVGSGSIEQKAFFRHFWSLHNRCRFVEVGQGCSSVHASESETKGPVQ